jgi:hypothetical protein
MNRLLKYVMATCLWCWSAKFAVAQSSPSSYCTLADAVVVGDLTVGVPSLPGTIRVDGILKGTEIVVGEKVLVSVDSPHVTTTGKPSTNGMWFLRRKEVLWSLISVSGPGAPIDARGYGLRPIPGRVSSVGDQKDCADSVISLLIENVAGILAVQSSERPSLTTLIGIARASSLAAPNPLRSAVMVSPMKSPDILAAIAANMIRSGSPDGLRLLVDNEGLLDRTLLTKEILEAVREWSSPEPEAITMLGRLSERGSSSVFAPVAAWSIARMHPRYSVPILVSLLSSADETIRQSAVNGLSWFVLELPSLTAEAVRNMEYLQEKQPPSLMLDAAIKPYVVPFPIKRERLEDAIDAWKLWWQRHRSSFDDL